jgi:hypothetical protein
MIAFGAALADGMIEHVPRVIYLVAFGADAKKAGISESGVTSIYETRFIRLRFPMAKRLPFHLWRVRQRPSDDADLEDPAAPDLLHASEEMI